MKKTRVERVENATVRMSNAADSDRRAEITASVTYNVQGMQNVSTGEVREQGVDMPLASFDQYGADNLNIRWNIKSETLTRLEVLQMVEEFITALSEENPVETVLTA